MLLQQNLIRHPDSTLCHGQVLNQPEPAQIYSVDKTNCPGFYYYLPFKVATIKICSINGSNKVGIQRTNRISQ